MTIPSYKILYVEDNKDNLKLVKRILMVEDYIVDGAENGRIALDYLQNQTPDLILLDINLPDIDGYTLAGQIRRNTKFASTPIVALTANVMKQDQEKSLAAGCNGFIKKPINVDTLPREIASYLTQEVSKSHD